MAGLDGFGTKFYRMSGTASTAVAGVTSIGGPNTQGKDIDITDMDSTNGFMEFLPGIVDAGEVSLSLNFLKAEALNLYALYRTTGSYKIVWPDSSNLAMAGYLKSFGPETPHDDKATATAAFKISGKPTFATS